jgi:hypothetical protein
VLKICTSDTPVEVQQEVVKVGLEICIDVFTTSNGTVLDWITRLSQNGILIIAEVDGMKHFQSAVRTCVENVGLGYPAAIIMGNRLTKFLPPGHTGSFHIWY